MELDKFLSLLGDIPPRMVRIGFDYLKENDDSSEPADTAYVVEETFEMMPIKAFVQDWYGDREFLSFNNILVSPIRIHLDGEGIGADSIHEFDEAMPIAQLVDLLEENWELPVNERKYRCFVSWYVDKTLVCSAQRWYHIRPADDFESSNLYTVRDRTSDEVLLTAPWPVIQRHFDA